jgi:hypothetical protein
MPTPLKLLACTIATLLILSACTHQPSQPGDSSGESAGAEPGETFVMRLNQTTTRDRCTACGCKANLINCNCSTQKQRACLTKKAQKFEMMTPQKAGQ